MSGPRLVHLTTTDMSLDWLLGPQLRAFAEAGYEVIGVSAPGPHVASLEAAGISHVALRHATRALDPLSDLRAAGELVRVLRELRPDILHTHNPKPGVYGRVIGRALRIPLVVNTVHGLYALPEDRLLKRTVVYGLERVAAACSDVELVQSVEDLATLRRLGVPADRLVELGNGIDLVRFAADDVDPAARASRRAEWGVGPDEVVVGLVGRLVREKGFEEVFAAATHLAPRLPQVRFVVVGPEDPDKADAVSSSLVEAARGAGVVFLGARTDMPELYAAMDVYVLASHREGFPRSAMEAAAMGLPVIATDIRGCRQVVRHGETGLLVPVRDPVGLAEAIGWLAVRPGERAAMGRSARDLAGREFDQRRVIERTLAAYGRLPTRSATSA